MFSDLRNLKPGTDACLEEPKVRLRFLFYLHFEVSFPRGLVFFDHTRVGEKFVVKLIRFTFPFSLRRTERMPRVLVAWGSGSDTSFHPDDALLCLLVFLHLRHALASASRFFCYPFTGPQPSAPSYPFVHCHTYLPFPSPPPFVLARRGAC